MEGRRERAASPPRGNSKAGCRFPQLLSGFLYEEKGNWWQNLERLSVFHRRKARPEGRVGSGFLSKLMPGVASVIE